MKHSQADFCSLFKTGINVPQSLFVGMLKMSIKVHGFGKVKPILP